MRFDLFKDRNFAGGCFFMALLGMTVFSTMALSTLFLQNVLGYPVLSAGLMMAARGLGTMAGMLAVGRLLRIFEARTLMLVGMVMTAITMYEMMYFTNMTVGFDHHHRHRRPGARHGPRVRAAEHRAFTTLPAHLRTDGAAILTLVRNIGSAIGIPVVIATLVHSTSDQSRAIHREPDTVQRCDQEPGLFAHVRHDDRCWPRASSTTWSRSNP